ncbi:MAG TPA: hypothetical protein ENI23_12120, partial [bacterium]|nr:hypothetical protein [bacterium]
VQAITDNPKEKEIAVKLFNNTVVHSSSEHRLVTYNRGHVAASDITEEDWLVIDKAILFEDKDYTIDMKDFSDRFDDTYVWNYMGFSPKAGVSINSVMAELGESKKIVETAIKVFLDGATSTSERVGKVVDYLQFVDYHRPRVKINRFIPFNQDLARLFGYYVAEGSNEAGKSIELCFHIKEKEYVGDVLYLVRKFFGVEGQTKARENKIEIRFRSSILSKLFSRMCGVHAVNKHIPLLCLQHRNKAKEFIKGYWRGDGSYAKGVFSVSTASPRLSREFSWLLTGFDIFTKSHRKSNPKNPAWNIVINGEDFNKFASVIDEEYRHNSFKEKKYLKRFKDFFVIKVKDISSSVATGRYYDIQVEGIQHFVAEGVLVHNSTVEGMATRTPLIFPRNTALPEILGEDRGLLVDSGHDIEHFTVLPHDNEVVRPLMSIQDMTDKMELLYKDEVLRMELAENGYNWVTNNLVWEKNVVPLWLDVLEEAVESLNKPVDENYISNVLEI